MNKQFLKKEREELEQFLYFRHRSFKIKNKKGKGSYKRKQKHNI